MHLLDNRVFVKLRLIRPDGTSRSAIFWVDSGGDTLLLGKQLASDLALKAMGKVSGGNMGNNFQPVTKPEMYIASMPLDLRGVTVAANTDSDEILPGLKAEGFFPATLLKQYDVVFDYPSRQFTLAEPGVLQHRGKAVPISIQPQDGFARIIMTIDGHPYGFMLDTGAAYSAISARFLQNWLTSHPSWTHSMGAVGAPNMIGKQIDLEAMLVRIPKIDWGPFVLEQVGMVARPARWYTTTSQDMTAPIVGEIGGNVLRAFRVEIDYPDAMTYLEKRAHVNAHDLDAVGIILQAKPDGTFIVSGVASLDEGKTVRGIQSGDRLLRINGWKVTGASLAAALQALHGQVGEVKTLEIQRGSKLITVKTNVSSHP